jgi:hypothetical protein
MAGSIMDHPKTFAAIFREELEGDNCGNGSDGLRPGKVPPRASEETIRASIDALKVPLSALCLSGGGIRSAAFALGVLQALARFRLLGQFDYLSTVSGGGYIGSWLSAWRYRMRKTFDLPAQVADAMVFLHIDRTQSKSGKEAPEIGGLRADSNYLTPKLGLLSADTWTVVALYIRNIVLNWSIFLPVFMGVLFIPRLFADSNEWLHQRGSELNVDQWLIPVGGAAATLGLAVTSYGRRSASRINPSSGWQWAALADRGFVLGSLVPMLIAASAFTGYAAAYADRVEPPALLRMALAGAGCYLLAWLAAGPVLGLLSARGVLVPGSQTWSGLFWDAVALLITGAATGALLGAGMRLAAMLQFSAPGEAPRDPASSPDSATWLTVLGVSWIIRAIFGGELIYIGLRSYSRRGDTDREWLARADGWLSAAAASWAVIASVALFGAFALEHIYVLIASALVGGASGIYAMVFGGGSKTGATEEIEKLGGYLSLDAKVSAAGFVFAVFLALAVAWLDGWLRDALSARCVWLGSGVSPIGQQWLRDLAVIIALLVIGLITSLFINVNRFSLHAVYRNRLVRAFLGSARAGCYRERRADAFTGFDAADNFPMAQLPKEKPLHLINITLNTLATKNLAWQERKAEAFSMTPRAAGNPNVGYRPIAQYGDPAGGITLGTAMAISGAAVSPNMGYHSSPLIGFLLMLFNIRLGWWLGNPARTTYQKEGPTFSAVPLAEELAGQTTDTNRWIYLSDGGHFENLGLYEMVRRRCRRIVVSDAGCDPKCAYEDLANAARKIYIDLGVSIDFETMDLAARQTPPKIAAYCALGRITYPGSVDEGWVLYIKPGYHGNEPVHIQGYANAHETFPHESTANQFFTESQFEAYRGLGAHIVELICMGGRELHPLAQPGAMSFLELHRQAKAYLAGVAKDLRPGCPAVACRPDANTRGSYTKSPEQ